MRVVLALPLLLGACASVPPESVELSRTVGEMIAAARLSHAAMVNRHFDFLEKEVERFVLHEYKPAFLRHVLKLLQKNDPAVKQLTMEQYDRALERVFKKRTEMLDAVRQDRLAVLRPLEEHYALLAAAQSELGALLRSAARVSESRNAILERVGGQLGLGGAKMKELEDKLAAGVKAVDALLGSAKKEVGED